MYRYETHLHTKPASACASATVRESLEFYESLGYDGVFITNHFLNMNNFKETGISQDEFTRSYFKDYEEAVALSEEIGIKIFPGVEMSFEGNHFLVFGLDKDWFLSHPEAMDMKFSDRLKYMREYGAFVSHAHPFDERSFIDHIKLMPRYVDAVEVINVQKTPFQNAMANFYADAYGLMKTAGSDNHVAGKMKKLAGIQCEEPIESVADFIEKAKAGKISIFQIEREDRESEFKDVSIEFQKLP